MKKRVKTIGFVLAFLLVIVGSTRISYAALNYYSDNYSAEMQMFDIGTSLVENGETVSYRNYTQHDDKWSENVGALLGGMKKGQIIPGKLYKEELTAKNSGSIDQYVRVVLKRYWVHTDKDKNPVEFDIGYEKATELSPELIRLHLLPENGWIVQGNDKDETIILYYKNILKPGETAPAFSDTFSLDESLWGQAVREEKTDEDGTKHIKVTYPYSNQQFMLEADVEAVQTHNAKEAIKSAWGVDVDINDGHLSIGKEE